MPILARVESPEPEAGPAPAPGRGSLVARRPAEGAWAVGERVSWVSGLVLAVSAFTSWYVGSGDFTLSVAGWHTGVLGKLVFFVGVAVVLIVALRHAGIDLPASVPESLVMIALGSIAMIFVLIRLISIPETFLPADGRGIGLWISLLASLGVIVGGLLRAAEEL
jgi:hypothetical protein